MEIGDDPTSIASAQRTEVPSSGAIPVLVGSGPEFKLRAEKGKQKCS